MISDKVPDRAGLVCFRFRKGVYYTVTRLSNKHLSELGRKQNHPRYGELRRAVIRSWDARWCV